jgi:hypothetical protein
VKKIARHFRRTCYQEAKTYFVGLQSAMAAAAYPQEKPIYIHLYSFRHPSGLGWIAWFQREG